jgi:hypothetical protein
VKAATSIHFVNNLQKLEGHVTIQQIVALPLQWLFVVPISQFLAVVMLVLLATEN